MEILRVSEACGWSRVEERPGLQRGAAWGSLSPAMQTPCSNTRCGKDTWLIKLAASRKDWEEGRAKDVRIPPHQFPVGSTVGQKSH